MNLISCAFQPGRHKAVSVSTTKLEVVAKNKIIICTPEQRKSLAYSLSTLLKKNYAQMLLSNQCTHHSCVSTFCTKADNGTAQQLHRKLSVDVPDLLRKATLHLYAVTPFWTHFRFYFPSKIRSQESLCKPSIFCRTKVTASAMLPQIHYRKK